MSATAADRLNTIPFAMMAGGWLGPLLMFWLYVWGPLRPYSYPPGHLLPGPSFALRVAVWVRRSIPGYRVVRGRHAAAAFVARTERSERGHAVLLMLGVVSAAYAWTLGWRAWSLYLTAGNLLVNLYPILLQRYTRSRLHSILHSAT